MNEIQKNRLRNEKIGFIFQFHFLIKELSARENVALPAIKKGDEILGNETRVKVVKNKVAPPFKIAEFEIRYGEGICKVAEIIDLGVEHKIVEKDGQLSQRKQCELLTIHRSKLYYQPKEESMMNLHLMKIIDRQYTATPFYGVPRMTNFIK